MNPNINNPDQETVTEPDIDREFLLERMGRRGTVGHTSEAESVEQAGLLSAGVRVGDDTFLRRLKEETANVKQFGLLVVKRDSLSGEGKHQDPDDRVCHTESIARIVEDVCRREKGVWGEIEGEVFGCCLPGFDRKTSLAVSREIQQQVGSLNNGSVSIGAAIYPMLDYDRGKIVENAHKALVHASFFGPGSVAVFDAVSLNISGDALYQGGDVAAAAKEFKRGLEIDPGDENLHNSLGVCYGVQGDQHKALEAFEKAINLNPDNVMALHNAGYSKSILNNTEGALAYFMKAHELDGDLFEVSFHTGKLLVEAGRPEEGQPFLEKALQLNPDSGVGYFFMGECYRETGKPNQAIRAYEAAVKRNPNDAGALSALGLLYDEKGENPEISLLFCEKSVELAPEESLYHYRLGTVLQKHGKMSQALDMFEKAQTFGYDTAERIAAIKTEMEKFSCVDVHKQA